MGCSLHSVLRRMRTACSLNIIFFFDQLRLSVKLHLSCPDWMGRYFHGRDDKRKKKEKSIRKKYLLWINPIIVPACSFLSSSQRVLSCLKNLDPLASNSPHPHARYISKNRFSPSLEGRREKKGDIQAQLSAKDFHGLVPSSENKKKRECLKTPVSWFRKPLWFFSTWLRISWFFYDTI